MSGIMNGIFGSLIDYIFSLERRLSVFVGFFYIFVLSLLFSLGGLGVKLLSAVPVYQNIFTTSLVSLILCCLSDGSRKVPKSQNLYRLLIQRGILGTMGFITMNQAIHYLPLSLVMLISQLSPIWIGLFGRIFRNEPFGVVDWLLTLTSLTGLVLIIQPEFLFGSSDSSPLERENMLIGVVLSIIFSFIMAAILIMISNLNGKVNVTIILFYFNIFSCFIAAIGSNYEGIKKLNSKEFWGLILVGVFYFVAQVARNRALYLEKAFIVCVGSYLQVIFSYFLDIFVLGIELNSFAVFGSVVVVVSVVGMMYYDQRKEKK